MSRIEWPKSGKEVINEIVIPNSDRGKADRKDAAPCYPKPTEHSNKGAGSTPENLERGYGVISR